MSERDIKLKKARRIRTRFKVRKKVQGTDARPRVCVFRSNKHIYAQVISDESQKTLFQASTLDKEITSKFAEVAEEKAASSSKSIAAAKAVGMQLATKLKEKGLSEAVFDRNGFQYRGRIKSLADGVREGGFAI